MHEITAIPAVDVTPVFELCIRYRHEQLGRFGQAHTALDWLGALQVALGSPIEGVVHDPACGYGGTLLAAAQAGATQLSGTDISPDALETARMRLEMHGLRAELDLADSLQGRPLLADRVLADPPMGMRLRSDQLEPWGIYAPSDDVGAWLRLARASLGPEGIGVVCVPLGRLSASRTFVDMVEDALVESVFLLPSGSHVGSRIQIAMVTINPWQRPSERLPVFDAQSYFTTDRGRVPQPVEGAIQELAGLLGHWRGHSEHAGPGHVCTTVMRSDIRKGFYAEFAPAPVESRPIPTPGARLLKQLRVENVKSFSSAQEARLAPITLVYGPNSAGKSTLVQALLMLLQSAATTTLITNGRLAQLGSFSSAVSHHDIERDVGLGIDFGVIPPWGTTETLHPDLLRTIDVRYSRRTTTDAEASEIRIGTGVTPPLVASSAPFEHEATASNLGGGELWSINADSLEGWAATLDDLDGAFYDPQRQPDSGRTVYKRLGAAVRRLQVRPGVPVQADRVRLIPSNVVVPPLGYQGPDAGEMLQSRLNRVMVALNDEVSRLADRVVRLGPVRPAPARVTQRVTINASDPADYPSFLFENDSAVEKLNEWLGELGIGYAVSIEPISSRSGLAAVGDFVAVVLTDLKTGVQVTPADVGYGVSQVLPIVVQCLQANEQVLCIEQPELHLHPRLQASLADLFIDSTAESGGGNQIIAETHSEHLLLRLRRRVREELISPDQISVLYVDHDDTGATVKQLRLGPQGEFLDPWPAGFFDDSLEDVLGGWT
ncbi:MAG: DUF3696 domain-containing protein [Propionibacteriaceae bacterium]|nr:DUF3696 domain-containing protein [Propionibacteriaceae bacterium]